MSWLCLISFLSSPWCVIVRFNLMTTIVFKWYRICITKLSKSKSLLKREDSSNTSLATTTLLGASCSYLLKLINYMKEKFNFVWVIKINLKTDWKWMLLLNNCSKTVSGHFFAICIFIFHKTEAHTVILRCTTGLNLNWFKSYGLRCSKMQSFPFLIFNDFVKKHKCVFFAFLGFVS